MKLKRTTSTIFLLAVMAITVSCVTNNAQQRHDYSYNSAINAFEGGDYARARRIFARLADDGNINAQFNLAIMYERGLGVRSDIIRAIDLFKKAARQGDKVAPNHLGIIYSSGKGVLKDMVLAHAWFNIASAADNSEGWRNRERIEKLMTKAQIGEAEEIARKWLNSSSVQ